MRTRTLLTAALLAIGPWQVVQAGEIVTWVDAQGVTHFGNPQLAPMDARAVEVEPANGMAVPQPLPVRSAGSGPVSVVLEKQPNRQLVGWRGHQWNVNRRRNHVRTPR